MPDIKNHLKTPAVTVPVLATAVMLILRLCGKFVIGNMGENENPLLTISILQLIIFILPCIFYYLLKGRRLETDPFFYVVRPKHIIFVLVSALVLLCGTLLIKYGQYTLFDEMYSTNGLVDSVVNNTASYSGSGIIIAYVIIPAVTEELFYRGIILSEYRPYGSVNAVIVSALCFAFMHFSFDNFLLYLFAGLVLGMVAVVTRSLLASVILHVLSNLLSLYGSDSFLRITIQKSGEIFMGFLLVVLFALSIILLLSRLDQVYSDYAEKPPVSGLPANSKDNVLKVFFSPAFLALVAVFVALTAFM